MLCTSEWKGKPLQGMAQNLPPPNVSKHTLYSIWMSDGKNQRVPGPGPSQESLKSYLVKPWKILLWNLIIKPNTNLKTFSFQHSNLFNNQNQNTLLLFALYWLFFCFHFCVFSFLEKSVDPDKNGRFKLN